MCERHGRCDGILVFVVCGVALVGCGGKGGGDAAGLRAGPLMFIGTQMKIYSSGSPEFQFLDINNDGFTDTWGAYLNVETDANQLAVAYGSESEILEPYFDLGTGDTPMAGDYDGDGRTDFVATIGGPLRGAPASPDIGVYWQEDDGTFGAFESLSGLTGAFAWDNSTSGDFNGDGVSDVVLTSMSGAYAMLIGSVGGGFAIVEPSELRPVMFTAEAVDINADGLDDIFADESVIYLSDGDGTFGAGIPFSFPGAVFDRLIDMTSDGIPDALGAFSLNAFAVLPGNGDGSFGDIVLTEFDAGAFPPLLSMDAVGDFDHDGSPDILTVHRTTPSTSSSIILWFGNGFGGFERPSVLFHAVFAINIRGVADLNRDGFLDFVTHYRFLPTYGQVHYGNGDGTIRDDTLYFDEDREPEFIEGRDSHAPDIDGDGIADFMTTVRIPTDGNLMPATVLHYGGAGGVFEVREESIDLAQFPPFDLDRDGDLDFLSYSGFPPEMRIYQFRSRDEIVPVLLSIPDDTNEVYGAYDMDADGRIDILLNTSGGLAVMYGQGGARFEPAQIIADYLWNRFRGVSDVTGDGIPDILGADLGSSPLFEVLPSTGRRAYGNNIETPIPVDNYAFEPLLMDRDVNRDGRRDVVLHVDTSNPGSSVHVWHGNSDGTFSSGGRYDFGGISIRRLFADDVDRDGDIDLVLGLISIEQSGFPFDTEPDYVLRSYGQVLGNNGSGLFVAGPRVPLREVIFTVFPLDIAYADVSGDGRRDLVSPCVDRGMSIAIARGDGTFGEAHHFWSGGWTDVLVGDFDKDGDGDVVATVPGSRNRVYYVENLSR